MQYLALCPLSPAVVAVALEALALGLTFARARLAFEHVQV